MDRRPRVVAGECHGSDDNLAQRCGRVKRDLEKRAIPQVWGNVSNPSGSAGSLFFDQGRGARPPVLEALLVGDGLGLGAGPDGPIEIEA